MRKILIAALLVAACKSEDKPAEPKPPAKPIEPAKPVEAPKPPPAPVVQGTVVQLAGIGADKNLEITLPPGLTSEITEFTESALPTAEIEGNGMKLVVQEPQAGQFSLADEQGMIQRSYKKLTIELAVEEPDGWTMIYVHGPAADDDTPESGKHIVVVARPKLGFTCDSYSATDRKQADDIVAICRTLKASTAGKKR